MDIARYRAVAKWAKDMAGVFTIADLKVALDEKADTTVYRLASALVKEGLLIKVKRGIYATPDASLSAISSRIAPQSYISTGTVLAQKAIIGSIPARKVQAVKIGRPRTYECPLGTIEHLSINQRLYFGFTSIKGELVATPEKALLDVCYFTYRGRRFSFDPGTDVNIDALDSDTIKDYLEVYDSRFVSFFNSIWRRP